MTRVSACLTGQEEEEQDNMPSLGSIWAAMLQCRARSGHDHSLLTHYSCLIMAQCQPEKGQI